MKDSAGAIIYVGKAKSIRNRLKAYLGTGLSAKTLAQMSHVSDIEFRPTPNESMALFLEAGLIREHKPRYNVALRDDKSYPFVRFSNEEFPAVSLTRRRINDGSRYFGPYADVNSLRFALKGIRRHFPYRTCKRLPKKACIYYRIGLSPAPCIGAISKPVYAKALANIALILEGRVDSLIARLSHEMNKMAREHNFEEAARMRDQIGALSALSNACPGAGADALEELKSLLKLKKIPKRIEGFDVSNISGQQAAGSMASFFMGAADKNNYRRFRIKTVGNINDYAMIRELVSRRYKRLVMQKMALPDLILIDGGRQHLSAAMKELDALRVTLPVVSIAKEEERLYSSTVKGSLKFKRDTPALNLIRRVRDETHRFALAYHHVLRRKRFLGR
jgi:excinuclease ABC subunit C